MPTPVGPRKRKEPIGRILEVGAGAAEGAGDDFAGTLLADDGRLQVRLELKELLSLLLLKTIERHASPVGDDVEHLIFADNDALLVALLTPIFEHLLALGAEFLLRVAEIGGFFELLMAGGVFLLLHDLVDFGLHRIDVGRDVQGTDTGAGTSLVHDVDGLIRKMAGGDIAMREADGGLDGGVGIFALMVLFVLRADAAQDEHSILRGRIVDLNGLEAAFEGGVLLDVLAELGERGGADALDFAAGQSRLEDVGSIHGAFGGAGTDNRVHLVDEEDDILGPFDLVHDSLDALFELAAVLRAGDHQGEVESDDLTVEEDFRDDARSDLLGEAFDDGGLAHAGFADEDRVILRTAAKDLHYAADFFFAADDRIEFAGLGKLGEIAAESLKQREPFATARTGAFFARSATRRRRGVVGGFFGRRRRVAVLLLGFIGGGRIDVREDLLATALQIDVELLKHARGDALPFLQQAEENVFGADIGVTKGAGFGDGVSHDLLHARREGDRVGSLRFFRTRANLLLDGATDRLEVEAHAAEDVDGDALAELDEPEQDVLRADVVMIKPAGFRPGQFHDLAGAGSEIVVFVLIHRNWVLGETPVRGW